MKKFQLTNLGQKKSDELFSLARSTKEKYGDEGWNNFFKTLSCYDEGVLNARLLRDEDYFENIEDIVKREGEDGGEILKMIEDALEYKFIEIVEELNVGRK